MFVIEMMCFCYFLKPALAKVSKINKLDKSEKCYQAHPINDLNQLIHSLCRKVMIPAI